MLKDNELTNELGIETMKIDAVVTWVDGNDPKHRQKRQQCGGDGALEKEDVGGETRFSNLGEIYWCVVSLNKFAPWLHKIYIVTDEQNPQIEDAVRAKFPGGYIPMEIVDHKIIFSGYEEYLPTFNSVAIETMTWRIPGLSDCFIEFNDDLMLAAPVTPEDFFVNGNKPICYSKINSLSVTRFTRLFKHRRDGSRKVTFKGSMINAAVMVKSYGLYFGLVHTPKPLRRDFYERYFTEHPELILRNIRFRFRDPGQFTPQELQYLVLHKNGDCIHHGVKGLLFYLQPKKGCRYVKKKLARLHAMKCCKFLCFNSIDLASESDQSLIFGELRRRFE